jgi:hypothetical protein
MKKLLVFILLLQIMVCNIARADTTCDWQFVKPLPDGGYEYPLNLHLCVGNLVQTTATQTQQIADLNAAIQLKNLAITTSDQRVALWQKTADDSQDRLTKIDSDSKRNDWIMFGLGALTVLGAGFMTAKLIGH